MDNTKLWLSLKEDNPMLFQEWRDEQNIDVRSCQFSGSGLMHWAAHLGAVAIMDDLLVEIPVDTPDNDGERPLQAAARAGALNSVDFLIKAGADLNSRSNDGRTALMTAAARKQNACAKRLLVSGADTSIPDEAGYTVYAYARTKEMSDLLKQYGGPEYSVVVSAKKRVRKKERVRMMAS